MRIPTPAWFGILSKMWYPCFTRWSTLGRVDLPVTRLAGTKASAEGAKKGDARSRYRRPSNCHRTGGGRSGHLLSLTSLASVLGSSPYPLGVMGWFHLDHEESQIQRISAAVAAVISSSYEMPGSRLSPADTREACLSITEKPYRGRVERFARPRNPNVHEQDLLDSRARTDLNV